MQAELFVLVVSALIVTWESGMILYNIDCINSVTFPVGLCVLKYLYVFVHFYFVFHYVISLYFIILVLVSALQECINVAWR